MTEEADLVVGAFYWVIPANDPDYREEWEQYCQPARFYGRSESGELIWQGMGCGGEPDDWSMKWIGPRIVSPMNDEEERISKANSKSPWI